MYNLWNICEEVMEKGKCVFQTDATQGRFWTYSAVSVGEYRLKEKKQNAAAGSIFSRL